MAKGSGTTKSSGASTNTGNGASLTKAQVVEKMGISENTFFNVTGMKYGHFLYHYQEQLGIINNVPDNADMFTGHKAGEIKEYLKKLIKVMKG